MTKGGAAALSVLVVMLAGCGQGAAAPAAASAPTAVSVAAKPPAQAATIRVGGLGGTPDRFLWVGQDKGYYAEQNLNLDVTTFKSFTEMVPLLATGKLDVGAGGISPGLFNAMLSGITLKVVSDVSLIASPPPGHHMSYGLMVRNDLKDKVKTVADMKGRSIGVNGSQGIGQVQLDAILHVGGLSTSDVDVQTISFPDAYAAMGNKKLDGALQLEPFITLAIQKNVAFPLEDLAKAMPSSPAQWIFYSTDFIQKQPDAGKRFLLAFTKSMRLIEDGFFKDKGTDEVIQMYVKHTQAKDPKSYADQTPTENEVNASINMQALESDEAYFVSHGWQKSKIDVNSVVDRSFGEYVRQTLGAYQR